MNVSLNRFQRPLRIYLSPQRSYCHYDSCTKNDITSFIFTRYEGLWSNSLALLHCSTDRIHLYEKFFLTESHHMTSKYLVISYIIINNLQTSFICLFFCHFGAPAHIFHTLLLSERKTCWFGKTWRWVKNCLYNWNFYFWQNYCFSNFCIISRAIKINVARHFSFSY